MKDKRRKGDNRYNLASCYKKLGKYNKAIEAFEECLKNDLGNEWVSNQANDLRELGEVYNLMGELKEALMNFEKSIKLFEQEGIETEVKKVKEIIEQVKKLI